MSEVVSKRTAIKELLELAKANNKITLGELNDRLSEIDLNVEDIEKIYEKLEKMGVELSMILIVTIPKILILKNRMLKKLFFRMVSV